MKYSVELRMVADDDSQALDMTVDMLPEIYFIEHVEIKRDDGSLAHMWDLGDWDAAQRVLFSDKDWVKKLKRCGNCRHFSPSDTVGTNRLDGTPGGLCDNSEYIDQLYPPKHVSDNQNDDLVHGPIEVDYIDSCEYYFEPLMLCPLCGRMMFIWHGEHWSSPHSRAICCKCQIVLPTVTVDDWRKIQKAAANKITDSEGRGGKGASK